MSIQRWLRLLFLVRKMHVHLPTGASNTQTKQMKNSPSPASFKLNSGKNKCCWSFAVCNVWKLMALAWIRCSFTTDSVIYANCAMLAWATPVISIWFLYNYERERTSSTCCERIQYEPIHKHLTQVVIWLWWWFSFKSLSDLSAHSRTRSVAVDLRLCFPCSFGCLRVLRLCWCWFIFLCFSSVQPAEGQLTRVCCGCYCITRYPIVGHGKRLLCERCHRIVYTCSGINPLCYCKPVMFIIFFLLLRLFQIAQICLWNNEKLRR